MKQTCIDLFGSDSLFQHLNRTCTGKGKHFLAEWLMSPAALNGEMYKGDEVKFDYILRDGMTTRMNAAILMKQMGII
ncbi:MAG: hypothetical protein ACQERS_12655 [Bacteroidota bacterium]